MLCHKCYYKDDCEDAFKTEVTECADFEETKAHLKKVYPTVPVEVYDIEANPEIAEMYLDEFGY